MMNDEKKSVLIVITCNLWTNVFPLFVEIREIRGLFLI